MVACQVVRPGRARVLEAGASDLEAEGSHLVEHVSPVGGANAAMEACQHELMLGPLQDGIREGHVLWVEVLPTSLSRVGATK